MSRDIYNTEELTVSFFYNNPSALVQQEAKLSLG